MKKVVFSLFFCLCFALIGKTQTAINPVWEWVVTDSSTDVNDWVMLDDHFYTIGNNMITKWDTNGNKLLMNNMVHGTQIIFDNSHHAIVLANMTEDSLTFGSTTLYRQGVSDILLYKIDSLLNIVWVKNIGDTSNDNATQFCIDYENNYYLVGAYNSISGIHKIDSNANFNWSKGLAVNTDFSVDLKYSEIDSTIVISGEFHLSIQINTTILYGMPSSWGVPSIDVFLAKLTLTGNLVFLKDISLSNNWSDWIKDMVITKQTGDIFIYQGRTALSTGGLYLKKYASNGLYVAQLQAFGFSPGYGGTDICALHLNNDTSIGIIYEYCFDYIYKIYNTQNNSLIKHYNIPIAVGSPLYLKKVLVNHGSYYICYYPHVYKIGNPPMSLANMNNTNICSNTSTFSTSVNVVSGNPPFTYSWQPTTSVSNPTILNPIFNISSTITYTLTVTDTTGQVVSDTIKFSYYQSPIDSLISPPNMFPCYGDATPIMLHCVNTSLKNEWYKNGVLLFGDTNMILAAPNSQYHLKSIDTISGCYALKNLVIGYHPSLPVIISNINQVNMTSDTCFVPLTLQYKYAYSVANTQMSSWYKDGTLYADQVLNINPTAAGEYILKVTDSICSFSDTIWLHPIYNHVIIDSICSNTSYTFIDGTVFTNVQNDTSHVNQFQTINNCDSIITEYVHVNPAYTQTQNANICSGNNYIFLDGAIFTNIIADTNHTSNLISVVGCDSIITEYVHVNPAYTQTQNANICSGNNYIFLDGTIFNNIIADTTHTSNLISVLGCDSNITEYIHVNPAYTQTQNANICSGNNYIFLDGTIFTNIIADTTHTSNLISVLGCDSNITEYIHVNPAYTQTLNANICSGNNYTFPDGAVFTNIQNDTSHLSSLTSNSGCDSIVTINLIVENIDTGLTQVANILTSNQLNASYQWIKCNPYTVLLNDTNQSYIIMNQGDYAVIIFKNGCVDTSACMSYLSIGIIDINTQSDIDIYPNPASTMFYIKYAERKKKELYNSVGQLIFTTFKNEIEVSKYSKGVYYLKCNNSVKKIIIE